MDTVLSSGLIYLHVIPADMKEPFIDPIPKPKRKTGLPPGSLIYTGEMMPDKIEVEYIRYNASEKSQLNTYLPAESIPGYHYWLDVRGIHDPALIGKIGEAYQLDALLLEDVVDPDQRPKLEQTEDGIFIILKLLVPIENGTEFCTEQISAYLTHNRLIVFQEFADDTFLPLKLRLNNPTSRLRTKKSDYLFYTIIDFVTDHYFPVLDQITDRINELERNIIRSPGRSMKATIFQLQQDIGDLQRIIMPNRELISSLLRADQALISDKTKQFLRDVQDNQMEMIDLINNQSSHLNSIRDLFMSEMTFRMTNIMMVLTVITSIFIPLTFLTSVYGMNFKHMPELEWRWSYPALWGIMILLGTGLIIYFRRRRWI